MRFLVSLVCIVFLCILFPLLLPFIIIASPFLLLGAVLGAFSKSREHSKDRELRNRLLAEARIRAGLKAHPNMLESFWERLTEGM
jgi:hypothetical protein